jgi:hypothetical protein
MKHELEAKIEAKATSYELQDFRCAIRAMRQDTLYK